MYADARMYTSILIPTTTIRTVVFASFQTPGPMYPRKLMACMGQCKMPNHTSHKFPGYAPPPPEEVNQHCSNDTLGNTSFKWTRQLISDFFQLNSVSKAEYASSTGVLEEEGGTGFLFSS